MEIKMKRNIISDIVWGRLEGVDLFGSAATQQGMDRLERFVLFPIKNKVAWDFYKKHLSSFWIAEEIDLR